MLQVNSLQAGYGKTTILHDISFEMGEGKFVCILGANGCGKTTLLKAILGIIASQKGQVLLDGEDVHKMHVKDLARKMAYIPQAHIPPFPFKVRDVVQMGRTPYLGYMGRTKAGDGKLVDDIMDMLEISWMAERSYNTLSGGQRQMVVVARALAQQPRLLIMDEPTASLDFGHQYTVLNQMVNLSQNGMSVIMVTHDPDHAFFCATKTITMKGGRILDMGLPRRVIVEQAMEDIYRTKVKIADIQLTEQDSTSICVPVHTFKPIKDLLGKRE